MKRLNRSASCIAGVAAILIVAWLRPSAPARAHGTSRFAASVTISGADLEAALKGARQEELFGFVQDDGEWLRVPIQLDERDAQGDYVASEDGGFDADDEVVLPVEHAGGKRPAGTVPSGLSRVSGVVEIKITDPLDAGFTSYCYVFRAKNGPSQTDAPVSFDAGTNELKSRSYRLGFADPAADRDNYVGIKHLSLYTSNRNLLDRLKIRIAARISVLPPQELTEEDLAAFASQLPGAVASPVKMGPVRGVMGATGGFAYADRVELVGGLPRNLSAGGGGVGITITAARVSLDFSAATKGSTYLDANLKEPVTIDGVPDNVPAGPIPEWREFAFTEGRAILLADVQPMASVSATVYYKDDQTVDGGDTGDFQSWGDTGVAAGSLEGLAAAGFPGEMVVLPEGRSVTAAGLVAQQKNPLKATWTVEVLDVGTEPPTAVPTVRATLSPPPTRPADRHLIYVPTAVKLFGSGS